MATNIDKALYQAPPGVADAPDEAMEIEIVDPEEVNIRTGDMELSIQPGADDDFYRDLTDEIDEGDLTSLAGELDTEIDEDKNSRKEWEKTYTEGLKLLGLQYEERTQPWTGACGVTHPLLTEAIVRFQSEAITETFPAQGPVKTTILGEETPENQGAAQRVQEDMNYLITDKMEFRPEHEKLLWSLPFAGAAFKKVYNDPSLGRPASVFIPAEDIILPYGVSDIFSSHRVTHEFRRPKDWILKQQANGFYRDVEIGDAPRQADDIQRAKDEETGFSDINDDRFVIREVHVDRQIPGQEKYEDGLARPYIITLLKGTSTILSIRRNWREKDRLCLKRQHFVQYTYIPGFGPYGYGLIHLIGNAARGATALTRQLIDAGTLSNLPGGLKTRGLRIKGDDTPIEPGEWRDVDITSGALRDSIMPLPYKEPSATLSGLLDKLVDDARRLAATADMQISDMSSQAPVGTTLALIERQLKVMTAIQGRMHYSLKQELRLIRDIVRDDYDTVYEYMPSGGNPRAKKADYERADVIPVSDPNAATLSQRVVQYQAVIQMAQMAPDIYDLPQLHRGMLEVIGLKNADKLVPLPDDLKPSDPVTENMQVLRCEPVKAFYFQDHESHILVHQALGQDPLITQLIGQNPKAQQITAGLAAHLAEHVAYSYRQKIEQQLGLALPDEKEAIAPELEKTLSKLMAQAAQQVLFTSKNLAAQQQAQQQAQNPVFQLQQQELQIKQLQAQTQAQKAQSDAQTAMQRLTLEAQRAQQAANEAMQRLDLERQKFLADAASQADKLDLEREKIMHDKSKHEAEIEKSGLQIGAELAKHREQLQHSKGQHEAQMQRADQKESNTHMRETRKQDAAEQAAAQSNQPGGKED